MTADSELAETVREARARAFATGGLPPDGGYSARWVPFKIGPIPLVIPNSDARRRAVRYHDLHHVATGYPTTWRGEFQISAWEIASGCAGHWFAWIINASGFAIGLSIWPGAVWRAFVRGRHSGNLYRAAWREALLDQTVADLRRSLRLDRPAPRARLADRLAFAAWAAGVVLAVVALGLAVVALV